MSIETSNKPWFGIIATALSLTACYGTLLAIAVLGALGVSIALNETLWAGAIVALAAIAVIAFFLSYTRHHKPLPLILGISGFVVVVYVMYFDYSRIIELAGFILLCLAAYLNWRNCNS